MSDWISTSIGSLFQYTVSGDWGTEPTQRSSVAVLRSTNFLENGRLDHGDVVFRNISSERLKARRVRKGDILIEKSGGSPTQPAGRVAYCDFDFIGTCSNFIEIARVRSGIDTKFAFYLLLHLYRSGLVVKYQQQTTGIINFKLGEYKGELVRIPCSPEEQAKIAVVLTCLDQAIDGTEALIAKQERIRVGLMNDLLTRGLDRDGQLRQPQCSAPDLYQHALLGCLPKEWQVGELGREIGPIISGWSPNCDSVPASINEWAVLKTTAVVWDGYRDTENKRLPENLLPIPSLEVKTDDILITRKGPVERVGVVVHVPRTRPRLMIPDTVFKVRLRPESKVRPAFLPLALASACVQRDWFGKKIGLADAQVDINHDILRDTLFPLPPPPEQEKIVLASESIRADLLALSKQLRKYQRIRDGLLHDLLSGLVSVTALVAQVAAGK